MKKILINFSSGMFDGAQKNNSKTGLEVGKFDSVIEYHPCDLSSYFVKKNADILHVQKGAGLWLWMPYVTLDALRRSQDGDYIFYCNSGSYWIGDMSCLIDELNRLNTFALLFNGWNNGVVLEKVWTKRDAFVLMDCDTPEYTDTPQLFSGFTMFRNCPEARRFVEDYLMYCEDPRIITDAPNVMGKPNYDNFYQHRQNQSVLSLVAKKWKIPACDLLPDQYRFEGEQRYPQLINHTRSR